MVEEAGDTCEATLALFGHKDFRQQLQPTALTFNTGSRAAMRFDGPAPPSPETVPPPPLTDRDVDPDYFRGGTDDEASAFLDQFTWPFPSSFCCVSTLQEASALPVCLRQ